jgi:hypothetical protein
MFFVLIALLLYSNEKKAVAEIVRLDFLREAPYWIDSIGYINDYYSYSSYKDSEQSEEKRKQQRPYIVMTAEYTLYINRKYMNYPFLEEQRRLETSIYLNELKTKGGFGYNITQVDSLWNCSLRRAGIEAETSIVLHRRMLRELFPRKDSINIDAPVRADTSRVVTFGRAICTDCVSIGFTHQGEIRGFAVVSPLSIIKRLAIPYTIIALIALFYLLLPPIGILTGAVGYRRNYIRFVGDAVFHLLTNEIIYGNGTCNKLGLNEFAILRMLVQSPVVSIEEIKSALWPDSTVKAQGKSFNVAFSSLCNILKEVDDITIERGAEEIILTDSTTKGVRRWQHFKAMIDILRKRV